MICELIQKSFCCNHLVMFVYNFCCNFSVPNAVRDVSIVQYIFSVEDLAEMFELMLTFRYEHC